MSKKFVIWIDEAWRWPFLWPVVACALSFDKNSSIPDFFNDITDSKKLSEKKREELYDKIIELSRWDKPFLYFWVWVVDNYIIDEVNIRNANKIAMQRALDEVLLKMWRKKVESIKVDWKDNYAFENIKIKPEFIIWWDLKVLEISCASIIAKVFRDKLSLVYDTLYPDVWIKNHKWYWTKEHRKYLKNKKKVTWIHRKSYKPIKDLLEK